MSDFNLAHQAVTGTAAFDYTGVPDQDREILQRAAQAIRNRFSSAHLSILAAGQLLLAVKDHVPHGGLGPWVEAELGITLRAAQNYMSATRLVQSAPEPIRETVSLLPAATLYKLAAPSTPSVVWDEVVQAAQAGSLPPSEVILRRLDVAVAEQREVARVRKAKPGRSVDQAEKIIRRTRAERERDEQERSARRRQEGDEQRAREAVIDAALRRLVAGHPEVMLEISNLMDGADVHRIRDTLKRHLSVFRDNTPGGVE